MIETRNFISDIKPYKPGKPIEEVARELDLSGEIIKLASNENPLGPSPLAVKAVKEKIKSPNLYPDDNCFYLKRKLSEKFGQPADNIIVGNGSVELIEMIFKAYVNPGDEVIMSEPSFIMYRIACQIYGGKRIAVPLVNYAHDIDTIVASITPRTKIVILDNPINPTGTIIKRDKFDDFIKKVPDNVILVLDEAYREYIDNENYPNGSDYLKDHGNLIVFHTFSKIYGLAGMRIGYGFSSPEIISNMAKVRLPFNVNILAQIAATAALDDDDFVKKSFKKNHSGKKLLYRELKKMGLKFVKTYGNFILVDFGRDAKEIFEAAQRKGMILRTVYEYNLPNCLRITIGTPDQNKKLIEVLKEIVK
jgi:histidinol-phosphate aminotransferase